MKNSGSQTHESGAVSSVQSSAELARRAGVSEECMIAWLAFKEAAPDLASWTSFLAGWDAAHGASTSRPNAAAKAEARAAGLEAALRRVREAMGQIGGLARAMAIADAALVSGGGEHYHERVSDLEAALRYIRELAEDVASRDPWQVIAAIEGAADRMLTTSQPEK